MKLFTKKTGLPLAALGLLLTASAAEAVSTTNNATVNILQPLTISANNNMNFGKVTKPATTGTVVLTSAGAISGTTGGITTAGGSPAAGTVNIAGDSTQTVHITVTDTTSVAGLSLSSFTGTFGGQPLSGGSLTGATLTGGSDTFSIGATLNINSQAGGFTTGVKTPTYTVDVAYD